MSMDGGPGSGELGGGMPGMGGAEGESSPLMPALDVDMLPPYQQPIARAINEAEGHGGGAVGEDSIELDAATAEVALAVVGDLAADAEGEEVGELPTLSDDFIAAAARAKIPLKDLLWAQEFGHGDGVIKKARRNPGAF